MKRLNNGESREAGFAKKKLAWNSFIISTKSIEQQHEVAHSYASAVCLRHVELLTEGRRKKGGSEACPAWNADMRRR